MARITPISRVRSITLMLIVPARPKSAHDGDQDGHGHHEVNEDIGLRFVGCVTKSNPSCVVPTWMPRACHTGQSTGRDLLLRGRVVLVGEHPQRVDLARCFPPGWLRYS